MDFYCLYQGRLQYWQLVEISFKVKKYIRFFHNLWQKLVCFSRLYVVEPIKSSLVKTLG